MNQEESFTDSDIQSYFFDSYAIFEIIKENKNYQKYVDSEIVITKLNLFELYHGYLKDNNLGLADEIIEKYYSFAEDFDENVIKEAAKMKKELNKRDLSMADCIGYSMAKQFGIKFLTGDEQFKDLENVEHVK